MKLFKRPSTAATSSDVSIDFASAKDRLPKVFESGDRSVKIETARVVRKKDNVSIVLGLVDVETGAAIDIPPLWVAGPNAHAGSLADRNQVLVERLLGLAGLPTSGKVGELIPGLSGLTFVAVLDVDADNRTGRPHNILLAAHEAGL